MDSVGGFHPGFALHYSDLHGPADHGRHCQQEGEQAEGETVAPLFDSWNVARFPERFVFWFYRKGVVITWTSWWWR